MKRICKFLAITYGELQSWYRHGEIKVNSSRISYIESIDSGVFATDLTAINSLLDSSPQLSFEEEEGILLIQFITPSKRVEHSEYDSLIIKFFDIEEIIPLTSRAKRILVDRLIDFDIRLSDPFFEKQVNQMWFDRRLRDAHLGGDALVEVLFNDAEQCIDESLRNSVAYAIKEIDFSDIEINLDSYRKTWLSKAFSFTRHRSSKHGSLEYFIDFGSIFKDSISENDNEFVIEFKDKLLEIKEKYKESEPKLDVLLCDKYVTEVSEHLLEKLPSFFCVPIEALLLFIKFKENFINAGQLINPELLRQELTEYSKIDFSHKVIATWLLGCYTGFQRISPIIYAANSQKIKFYKGETLLIDKIDKHEPVVDLENIVKKEENIIDSPSDNVHTDKEIVSNNTTKKNTSSLDIKNGDKPSNKESKDQNKAKQNSLDLKNNNDVHDESINKTVTRDPKKKIKIEDVTVDDSTSKNKVKEVSTQLVQTQEEKKTTKKKTTKKKTTKKKTTKKS